METATVMSVIALCAAVAAVAICAWAVRVPPQGRVLRETRAQLEELQLDVEQLHALHHKSRRRENVELARTVKAKGDNVVAEAAELLAQRGPAAAAPLPAAPLSKAALRARVGLVPGGKP